jgi:hypothetical protein
MRCDTKHSFRGAWATEAVLDVGVGGWEQNRKGENAYAPLLDTTLAWESSERVDPDKMAEGIGEKRELREAAYNATSRLVGSGMKHHMRKGAPAEA